MKAKGASLALASSPLGKQLEVDLKKKKKSKGKTKASAARALLEQYGLCPISMEPMRRPVLPSSGQAFDEINIVRYCSTGNRRCPVSGATLKFHKGKVAHTVDFALRNLIRAQAASAKVPLPAIDKAALFRELRAAHSPEAAKAVVDDCYLGHVGFEELGELLDEFSAGKAPGGGSPEAVTATFHALLAECLACRRPEIVDLAVGYMEVYCEAWKDPRVLYEAMAVAQDPDSRGQVLVVLEEKVHASKEVSAQPIRAMLGFETESVPVQQFQARVAQIVIQHGGRGLLPPGEGFEAVLNLALRAREDLDGCLDGDMSIYEVWACALGALRGLGAPIDDATLERLFWRENRMVLQHLASGHEELLAWHLGQHKGSLALCIGAIGGRRPAGGPGAGLGLHEEEVYTSDEEYYSEDEEAFEELSPPSAARGRAFAAVEQLRGTYLL